MEKELKDQIERLKRDLDNSRKNQPNEPDPRKVNLLLIYFVLKTKS